VQFNFWWFTSNAGTNILIATAIWFVLFVGCQKICTKDQETHPLVYIGYGIASFGAGIYSVLGIYGGLTGALIAAGGLFLAIIIGVLTKPKAIQSGFRYAPTGDSSVADDTGVPSASCPDCGATVQLIGGIVKPDGSIVCTTCMKKFIP